MDLVPLLLLIIIVVLGGAIAYFADRLGRVLGKKRLSLFKLRPRHTAELLTVGAGMLIPLLTIVVLAVASSGIRKWIALGPSGAAQLRESVDRLTLEQQGLKQDVTDLQRTKTQLSERTSILSKKVTALGKEAQEQLKKTAEATRKASAASARAAVLNRQISTFVVTLRTVHTNLKTAQHNYDEARKRYTAMQASFAELQKSSGQLQVSFKELSKQYRELLDEENKLTKQRDDLQDQVTQLGVQKTGLDEQLKQVNKDLEGTKGLLETTRLNLDAATQQLQQAMLQTVQATQALESSLGNTRFKPLIFPVGSELARISLRPGMSPVDVRSKLQMLISESSRVAGEGGAKPSRPGEGSALMRNLPLLNGRENTVQEQIGALLREASDQPDESVLVANAYWNTYLGESLPLQIHAYPNPVVYHTNDLIAEARVDGSLSENEIVNQIRDLLLHGVRNRAMRDHMIPNGGEGSFGTLSTDQMLEIVKKVKEENRRVRLQFLAKGETRAGDPLQLAYRIRY